MWMRSSRSRSALPPDPDGWCHVTIRVDGDTVKVLVDRATPALDVTITRSGRP
jgi:hypothetical protein